MAEILTQQDIEKEIVTAVMNHKQIDLSNKIIQEINLSNMEIKAALSFEGAKFLGGAYFEKTIFDSDLIFKSAIFNNVIYMGEANIKGNFDCQEARVREGLNLIGITVEKNFIIERAKIQGFLGMKGATINGDVNFKKVGVLNSESSSGIIAGDVYLQRAKIKGSVDFTETLIAGTLDMRDAVIGGSLNLTQTKIQDYFLLKNGIIRGEIKLTGLDYGEKVI